VSSRDVLEDENIDWVFPDLRPRGAGQGGDLTQFTMGGELETFVREVLQNANDAAYSEVEEPVEVDFRIEELTGDDLEEFKSALRWDEWKEQVDAATEETNQIAKRIHRFAEKVEDRDSLRLLTVEDKYTQGLTGPDEDSPERGSTNFSALVRDSLESNKEEEASGGKFGLGKAVLRIFSGTSMVLFNSVLSENDPRPDFPRVIGRTKLPQHWKDETRHNGQGFFGDTRVCEDEYEPPGSLWGEEAASLAESLHLSRPDDETPGTSIMVVGFRDPSKEERRGLEELAEEIRDEAVKWFWPAIWRGDLRVSTHTPTSTYEGTIDEVPKVKPFVDCLESEYTEQLEESGDVSREYIDDISIPDRENGNNPEMTDEGSVGLAVRLTFDDERPHTNNVALIRGAGMVVRYWDRNKLVHGNRNFHAIALGGEARAWLDDEEPTDDDTDVENFLKDAEPPAHDDWEQTEATRDDYKLGTKSTIDDIKAEIEELVGQFVGPNFDRGMRGPQRLANRFPITNQGTADEPDGTSKIDGSVDISRDNESEQWEFSATVKPAEDEYELVEVEVSLPRMSEERQMQDDFVPIGTFDTVPSGCAMSRRENGRVVVFSVDGNRDKIEFSGQSEADPLGVKTRLNVDGTVRRSEVTDDE